MNNAWAASEQSRARKENYEYGEMAANSADKRTRALYNDFYSPEAMIEQYKAAGLSPSMMYGGTPGQGGMMGAQGTGANGPGAITYPYSITDAAQAAALFAQADKAKAETKNIEEDTILKELEERMSRMNVENELINWNIVNSTWVDPNTGKATSLFEMAKNNYSYESFLNDIREHEGEIDPTIYKETQTEQGQKTLRNIYESASRFSRDISILSKETVDAHFQMGIIQALENIDYTKLNAKAVKTELEKNIATNGLTEEQKSSWTHILDLIGKKGSTQRDIAVVLMMILSNFASHTGIKLSYGK